METGYRVNVLLLVLFITAVCFVIYRPHPPAPAVHARIQNDPRGQPNPGLYPTGTLATEKEWREISDEEWKTVREPFLQLGFIANEEFPYRIECSTMTWASARAALDLKAEEASDYQSYASMGASYYWYKSGIIYRVETGARWTNFVKPSTNWIRYDSYRRIPTADAPVSVMIMHWHRKKQ
jgi:hypothetical protein